MPDSGAATSDSKHSPWAAFTHIDFFLIWSSGVAMTVSMLLRMLVCSQWLYDITGSASQLGLLGAVQFVQLPVALYGGALADRMDRKKLMILTQLVGTLSLLFLAVLSIAGVLAPWHIFLTTGLSSMANTLGSSARPAMLPRVVPRGLLTHAVTMLNVTGQLASVFGPILFWWLYEGLGVSMSFGIATAISSVSVILPFFVKASGQPETKPKESTWASLKAGGWFIFRHPLLPGIFLLDFGVTIVSFYRQLFPVFADQLYGLGAEGTGFLNTANAIGGIIGTLGVFYAGRYKRKGLIVLAATMVYAVFLIAFGVNTNFILGLVIIGILGLADSITVTLRQVIVQLTTPDNMLGRSASIRSFAAMSANNLGQIEVGVLSGIIGAGPTMWIGGILSVVFVAAIWKFMPKIRNYIYQ